MVTPYQAPVFLRLALITRSTSAYSRTKQEPQIVCETGSAGVGTTLLPVASTIGDSMRPHHAQTLWIVRDSADFDDFPGEITLNRYPFSRPLRAQRACRRSLDDGIGSYDTHRLPDFTAKPANFGVGDQKMGIS